METISIVLLVLVIISLAVASVAAGFAIYTYTTPSSSSNTSGVISVDASGDDSGISGGNITTSGSIAIDIPSITEEKISDSSDYFIFQDESAAKLRKQKKSDMLDGVTSGVTSVDASGINSGISGGNITSTGSIAIDIPSIAEEVSSSSDDYLMFYDTSAGGLRKQTKEDLLQDLISVVFVRTAADLLPPLDNTKMYVLDGIIDMGSQSIEVPSGGLNLLGYSFDVSKLISSAAGYVMFTSPIGGSGNVLGREMAIEVTGSGSSVYNLVGDTGFEAIELVRVNWNDCENLGTITNYRQGLETGTGRFGGSPNLTLAGTWVGGYFIDTSIVRNLDPSMTGALYQAAVGFTMSSRFRSNQNVDLPASVAFLDFSPAEFPNSSTVQLDGCLVSRNGVFDSEDANITPNLNPGDLPAKFLNNVGMKNTFVGGRLDITAQITTVISTINTFVVLAGTMSSSDLQHFDSPVNGQLRHLGNSPNEFSIRLSILVEGPANDLITLKVVKWDDSASSFVDVAELARTISSLQGGRDVAYMAIDINVDLDIDDYIRLEIANNSGTGNLTAEDGGWLFAQMR